MTEAIAESVARLPALPLRAYIDRYIGYRFEGFAAGMHRGLPSRHLTFIVSLQDQIDVAALAGSTEPPGSFTGLISGFCPGPAIVRHDGTQVGVCAELSPLGARALLGLPAGALASNVAEPHDIVGRVAVDLPERLASAPSWGLRFDVLDDVLLGWLRERQEPRTEVAYAWRRLIGTSGSVSVQELANETGWSRRHLSQRFRSEVGLSPKMAARMLRFDNARRMLERATRPGLSEVAVVSGYFDQAHLTRDFNDFAGCSPTVWMAEEFPSVQDKLASVAAE
jgi:AraC-like DNA-binding protein